TFTRHTGGCRREKFQRCGDRGRVPARRYRADGPRLPYLPGRRMALTPLRLSRAPAGVGRPYRGWLPHAAEGEQDSPALTDRAQSHLLCDGGGGSLFRGPSRNDGDALGSLAAATGEDERALRCDQDTATTLSTIRREIASRS